MPVYKSGFLVAALAMLTCSAPLGAQDCVPNGQCGAPPDVTGTWYTRHTYDISQAVPPALAGGFVPLTELGPRIAAAVNLRPNEGALEPIIAAAVTKHLSPSLPAVLRIGKGMSGVVSTVRSEGVLRLGRRPDPAGVNGSEVWTNLVFYWLGLCGDNIGGDPEEPPECARFDIATSDNDNPSEPPQCKGQSIPPVSVRFSGTLRPSAQPPQWELVVDDRVAVVPAARLLVRIAGELLQRTTPWQCIDEATDCASASCVVDCAGLGKDLAEQTPRLDADRVEEACVRAVRKAGRDTRRALTGGWADVALLRYSGTAAVGDKTLDGFWKGTFFSKVLANMPGAWHATR